MLNPNIPPPDDAQMTRLAKGLGIPLDASMYEKASPKAGLDVGQWFYIFIAGKLRIALREDDMVAYICEAEASVNDEEIIETLKICNFVDAHIPPSGHIHGLLSHQWVPVCEGKANSQPIWTDYCLPGEPQKLIPANTLRLMSLNLESLWERTHFNNTKLKAGTNIRTEEENGVIRFYAQNEGILHIFRDTISVLLIIEGDINYKIGNLEFDGEIFIKGSVGLNFSVSSESNITVGENVETRIVALGNVQAQFVQDAQKKP